MDNFQLEYQDLEHNFCQLLYISQTLYSRNEMLQNKIKKQEEQYQDKLRNLEKNVEELRKSNFSLQKRVAMSGSDAVSVVSKEFQDVIAETTGIIDPKQGSTDDDLHQSLKDDLSEDPDYEQMAQEFQKKAGGLFLDQGDSAYTNSFDDEGSSGYMDDSDNDI